VDERQRRADELQLTALGRLFHLQAPAVTVTGMVSHWGPCSFAAVIALVSCLGCSGDDSPDDENEGNVSFSTMCSIPTCGGDPTGEWDAVGGCVQPSSEDYDCDWRDTATGDVSGTVSFQGGNFSIELETQLLHCDTIDLSSNGSGGTYTITANEILASGTSFVFCVDGDTLMLWERAATSPDMNVLVLTRRGS
jgi:hypothetical protein